MTRRATERLVLRAFEAGLEAADPVAAVRRSLSDSDPRWPLVVAVGKAALPMLEGAAPWVDERGVEDRGSDGGVPGVVVTTADQAGRRAAVLGVEVFGSGHPVPDAVGERAAVAIEELLTAHDEDLLVLVSGGASALLPAPAEGVRLADKMATTRALLSCGATIHEINTVRKHLSRFKGGGLAALAARAERRRSTVLVLSDVPGDDLSVVGSGPMVPDPSTFDDALAVLDRHDLGSAVPPAVLRRLELGAAGEVAETPSPGDPVFDRVEHRLVGGNAESVAAAAVALGSSPRVRRFEEPLEGEARDVGRRLARELRGAERAVAGGETTVTLRGDGLGGRNQELAVAFALEMHALGATSDWAFLSAGTDGRDGPTDAAGAVVGPGTVERGGGRQAAERALEVNDTYRFLEAAGGLVLTGETGTNVADLQIYARS